MPRHHWDSCGASKGLSYGGNDQRSSLLAFDSKVWSILPLRLGNSHQHELCRIKKHLEPLARVACITQARHCGLDQVLLVFGSLYGEYLQLKAELDDNEGLIQVILDSIEKRWQKSDQDVFIAALILNPMYKTSPFSQASLLNHANVFSLLCHLWRRFYKTNDIPPAFFSEVRDYLDEKHSYETFGDWVTGIHQEAEANVCYLTSYNSQLLTVETACGSGSS